MNIEELREKVKLAGSRVLKCEKTVERHVKQLEQMKEAGETGYKVTFKEEDIRGAQGKLRDAERILSNWEKKLRAAGEDERFLEANTHPVLREFLERWKNMTFEWYVRRYKEYIEYRKELQHRVVGAKLQYIRTSPEFSEYVNPDGSLNKDVEWIMRRRDKGLDMYLKERGFDWGSVRRKENEFAGAVVLRMFDIQDESERLAWLNKELEREKRNKLIDLVSRITKVTGRITDATCLRINEKGNLDGYIVGEDGKAKVETIGAGGWNVQVFHYRTLVHSMEG